MTIQEVFLDKSIKAKGKVALIGDWLVSGEMPIDELIAFAGALKPINRATCIEAVEYATKKKPEIADASLLAFAVKSLKEPEPRVKWESAKVIGNIARLFPSNLDSAVEYLLENAENDGTVVRWATAYALAEILKLKTQHNSYLLSKIEDLSEKEVDNGVKKKYLDALKKVKK